MGALDMVSMKSQLSSNVPAFIKKDSYAHMLYCSVYAVQNSHEKEEENMEQNYEVT